MENHSSIKARFYELDNGDIVSISKGLDEHQSYPNRMHGGVISALLDETVGRAIWIVEPGKWGVTVELTVNYKKPVPLNEELKVFGRVTKNSSRLFEGTGELVSKDGEILATCTGKYMKMSLVKIADHDHAEEFMVHVNEVDPKVIERNY
jgi:uncharacterized protein (TIGR00369 family)